MAKGLGVISKCLVIVGAVFAVAACTNVSKDSLVVSKALDKQIQSNEQVSMTLSNAYFNQKIDEVKVIQEDQINDYFTQLQLRLPSQNFSTLTKGQCLSLIAYSRQIIKTNNEAIAKIEAQQREMQTVLQQRYAVTSAASNTITNTFQSMIDLQDAQQNVVNAITQKADMKPINIQKIQDKVNKIVAGAKGKIPFSYTGKDVKVKGDVSVDVNKPDAKPAAADQK